MPKELVGLVINPKKSKKRSKRKREARKTPVKTRAKNVILIANPVKDHNALIELSLGAAAGLAGGKLLDKYVYSKMKLPLPAGISAGDLTTLIGAFLISKRSSSSKEFSTGMIAGSGAKIILGLLDRLVFKNENVISLHGEPNEEPYPDVDVNVDMNDPDLEDLPQEEQEEIAYML